MKNTTLIICLAVMLPVSYLIGRGSAEVEAVQKQHEFEMQLATAPYPELNVTEMAELINKERTAAGLAPLAYDQRLEAAACAKADDLIAKNYWSHYGPDGSLPWDFFDRAGYGYYKAGENLAYGYRTEAATVKGWMNSPGHKENIMAPFTQHGLCVKYGVYQGSRNAVIVNHFGIPL